MNNELIKEKFEKQFFKVVKTRSIKNIEKFLSTSKFDTFSLEYRQSVLDYFVYSDYKYPDFKLAKWALHTNITGLIGNIHENADRPLRLAAQFNVNYVKYLLTCTTLTEKANINTTNDGSSALLEAIKTNNINLVQYLTTSPELEIKAKIDIADEAFNDPLCKACDVNDTDIVKFLLNQQLYPHQKDFNPATYLTKFNYHAIRKIISHDNLELFKFIIEEKLFDVTLDLHNWFCSAIIADAKAIATYLEDFFTIKPDLAKMKYKEHSLFVAVAQTNHYSCIQNHSYLHSMLDKGGLELTPEEIDKINRFYVYHDKNNATKLSIIMEKYQQKNDLEKKFPPKNLIDKKFKI